MRNPARRLYMAYTVRVKSLHTSQNSNGRISRRRQGLGDVDFAVAFIQQHKIREGTAYINAKAVGRAISHMRTLSLSK